MSKRLTTQQIGKCGELLVQYHLLQNGIELAQEQIWIIKNKEMESLAQQKPSGRYHFFMVLDPEAKDRKDKKKFRNFEFEKYKLENRLHSIFG